MLLGFGLLKPILLLYQASEAALPLNRYMMTLLAVLNPYRQPVQIKCYFIANTFYQSRKVVSSLSNYSFNHLSLSSLSSYFAPGSALGFTHLSATFQLLSRLYAHHFSVVSPRHVISRSCASCPPALQRYFSSSLKSFA